MKNSFCRLLAISVVSSHLGWGVSSATAHSGGTDARGCHVGHCHNRRTYSPPVRRTTISPSQIRQTEIQRILIRNRSRYNAASTVDMMKIDALLRERHNLSRDRQNHPFSTTSSSTLSLELAKALESIVDEVLGKAVDAISDGDESSNAFALLGGGLVIVAILAYSGRNDQSLSFATSYSARAKSITVQKELDDTHRLQFKVSTFKGSYEQSETELAAGILFRF